MSRDTENALLVLLGAVLVRIAVDDTFLRYVKLGHRWLLIGAGVAMIALAVIALLHDMRERAPADAEHGSEPGIGHGHEHGGGFVERHVPWLLMAPALVVTVMAPPALGADSVNRISSGSAAPISDFKGPPLPDGPVQITLREFALRTVWEPGSVNGREITLIGFAVPRDDGRVALARLKINCCAADASAILVELTGPGADELSGVAPDTWLRVRGVFEPGSASKGDPVPTMTVIEAVPEQQPGDPYEN